MAFKKGVSGNPQGRPVGIEDRRSIFRNLIENHKEKLVMKAVELALNGNEQMLRLLLDRLLPAKPKEEPLSLNEELQGSSKQISENILRLMSEGIVTPSEGQNLLQSLTLHIKITEVDELAKRIEKLEEGANGNYKPIKKTC